MNYCFNCRGNAAAGSVVFCLFFIFSSICWLHLLRLFFFSLHILWEFLFNETGSFLFPPTAFCLLSHSAIQHPDTHPHQRQTPKSLICAELPLVMLHAVHVSSFTKNPLFILYAAVAWIIDGKNLISAALKKKKKGEKSLCVATIIKRKFQKMFFPLFVESSSTGKKTVSALRLKN